MPRLDPVWRPERGPSKREITSSLNIKSEKATCPFVFRSFRTTAFGTALEIVASACYASSLLARKPFAPVLKLSRVSIMIRIVLHA